jgi:uncharacterized protein YaiE (UPF0345 family)
MRSTEEQARIGATGGTGPALTFGTADAERMRINSNGNVGIGTSSPDTRLKIQTPDSDSNVSLLGLRQNNAAGTAQNTLFFNINPATSTAEISSTGTSSPDLAFLTSNQEAMRIKSNGNVGIGTIDPDAGLHIVSSGQTVSNIDTSSNINALVTDNGGFAGNGGSLVFAAASGTWRFAAIKGLVSNGANNSVGDLAFSTRRNTTDSTLSESMRIAANGNVGIGTSSPGSKLEVEGNSTDSRVHISNTSSGGTAFDGSGSGLLLTAGAMNSTSKFTPAIQFGSIDGSFTTTNPKVLAAINGVASQSYTTDTAGAMELAFYTTPLNQSTGNDVQERLRIDRDGNVGSK